MLSCSKISLLYLKKKKNFNVYITFLLKMFNAIQHALMPNMPTAFCINFSSGKTLIIQSHFYGILRIH